MCRAMRENASLGPQTHGKRPHHNFTQGKILPPFSLQTETRLVTPRKTEHQETYPHLEQTTQVPHTSPNSRTSKQGVSRLATEVPLGAPPWLAQLRGHCLLSRNRPPRASAVFCVWSRSVLQRWAVIDHFGPRAASQKKINNKHHNTTSHTTNNTSLTPLTTLRQKTISCIQVPVSSPRANKDSKTQIAPPSSPAPPATHPSLYPLTERSEVMTEENTEEEGSGRKADFHQHGGCCWGIAAESIARFHSWF